MLPDVPAPSSKAADGTEGAVSTGSWMPSPSLSKRTFVIEHAFASPSATASVATRNSTSSSASVQSAPKAVE